MGKLFEEDTAKQFIRDNQLSNGLDKSKNGGLFTSQGDITIREGILSVIFDIEDIKIAKKVLKTLEPYLKRRNPDVL